LPTLSKEDASASTPAAQEREVAVPDVWQDMYETGAES
jgi:hypothetical protein